MKFLLFIGLLFIGLFAEQVQITADSFDGDENALVANLNGNVTIKNGKYDTLQANKAKILFDKNKKIKTKREYTNNIIVFLIKLHLKLAVSFITHPLT